MIKYPSVERLRSSLSYNANTGLFRWRISPNGRITVGQIAGTLNKQGYIKISLDGSEYGAHNLAWLHFYGLVPRGLDHWNLDRADNRIKNLRSATRAQNNTNKRCYRNNVAGIKGVFLKEGRWRAQIRKNGTTVHIGYYDTASKAAAAYRAEAIKINGDFACFAPPAAAGAEL